MPGCCGWMCLVCLQYSRDSTNPSMPHPNTSAQAASVPDPLSDSADCKFAACSVCFVLGRKQTMACIRWMHVCVGLLVAHPREFISIITCHRRTLVFRYEGEQQKLIERTSRTSNSLYEIIGNHLSGWWLPFRPLT